MSGTGDENIQELDVEIKRVETQESMLVDESAGVSSHLARPQAEAVHSEDHHGPIDILPPELLSRIFEEISSLHKPPKRFFVPYRLLGVTKHWRDIVLGTSSLWTSVNFDDEPTMLPLLTQHLERSQKRPLDIYINSMSDTTFAQARPFMDISRWRQLRIYLRTRESLFDMLARLSETEAPLLERLSLACDLKWQEDVPVDARPLRWNMIGGVPRLEYLHLDGILPRLCMLPGDVITTFHFCYPVVRYSDFRNMLTSLPVLKTLIVEDSSIRYERETSLDEFELPCLTTLLFASDHPGPRIVSTMVSIIRAPLLRRLSLIIFNLSDNDRTLSMLSNGSKFPELRCLELNRSCGCPELATRDLIAASPKVTELILGDWCWFVWEDVKRHYYIYGEQSHLHLLDILAIATDRAPQDAWPDLRTITVGSFWREGMPDDHYEIEADRGFGHALLECLRARRRANMPIQLLRLHPDILCRISPQTLAALRDEVQAVESFKEEGALLGNVKRRRPYLSSSGRIF
ncbi:hypothetical protein PLICRDRAFT_169272 [Plicaturopsis crispa FD-325 SS-3]|nr:hypothetical protein PLICRDRAFT_169272 [Plicaturopsis crispa FD-325 SS-3]